MRCPTRLYFGSSAFLSLYASSRLCVSEVQCSFSLLCWRYTTLPSCFEEVKLWMSEHFLKLNEDKTEASAFGSSLYIADLENQLSTLSLTLDGKVKNWFWLIIWKSDKCFFHIRFIAKLKQFLSHKDLQIVIHALIRSRVGLLQCLIWGFVSIYCFTPVISPKCSS